MSEPRATGVGRRRELPGRRRHDRVPRRPARPRLAGRQLEVIVVDNASGDGERRAHPPRSPTPRSSRSTQNTGFAGGCNLGAAQATGEYVAFLNNDARPDRQWLAAAVDVLARDASDRVRREQGARLGGRDRRLRRRRAVVLRPRLQAARRATADSIGHDRARDVLFATGAAMVMPTPTVFRDVGGFDERYFMFFEDVDLGWRLWLLGYRVRYVPESLVYHRHHASMDGFGTWREHYLLERNALFTIYKNYDDEQPADGRCRPRSRSPIRRGVDARRRRPARARPRGGVGTDDGVRISRRQADARCRRTPSTPSSRSCRGSPRHASRAPGRRRRRPDHEILRLFRLAAAPQHRRPALRRGLRDASVDAFGDRRRVQPSDAASSSPPATRSSRRWPARRSGPGRSRSRCSPRARRRARDRRPVRRHRASRLPGAQGHDHRSCTSSSTWCDVIDLPGLPACTSTRRSRHTDKIIVADIYDPFHLEQLEQARDLGPRPAAARWCVSSTRGPERAAHARRLLPVRERQAARLLARPARRPSAGSTRSPTTTTRRLDALIAGRAVRRERRRRRAAPAPVLKGSCPASAPTTRSSSGAAASTTGSTRSRCSGRSTSCGPACPTCGCSSSG